MMKRRAFTLIELLVVIAIIAVLAAILFPVFAQAKRAAKGTVSVSNTKQLTLAALMYSNDHDDVMVLSGSYNTGEDPLKFSDGTTVSPWSWLIVPYVKTGSMYDDPAGKPTPSLYSLSELVSKIVIPQYGYNHFALSPTDTSTPDWDQIGVSVTTLGDPAGTVMLASKFGHADSPALQRSEFVPAGNHGAPLWTTVEGPYCDGGTYFCVSWGHNDILVNGLEEITDAEAGAFSGGVSTRADGAVVSFAEGHAKKLSLGALAAGTNWSPQIESSSVLLTDKSKYLWDRD